MYRYLIVSFFINICFGTFMIGVDFASNVDDSQELDIGFSLSYDHKTDSKFGFGFEYLFPTEMEDLPEAKLSTISIYGIYNFIENSNVTISGKIGYSMLELDFDIQEMINLTEYPFDFNVDNSGGVMCGIKAAFGPMNIMYSFHKGELRYTDLTWNGIPLNNELDDISFNLNRITASYSF